jgi:Fur family ferric uptake transcriptional regulator
MIPVMGEPTERRERSEPTERFSEYLRDRGVKFTAARRRILEAALDLGEYFEAEQVLYLLRERGQKVGKATVYRTLPLLVGAGILRPVRFDVKQTHYERADGQTSGDHLVCKRCGRVVRFASEEVSALRDRIAKRQQFQVLGHRFQIAGLCRECRT